MIPRFIEKHVSADLAQDLETILILGARQVGKTTLIKIIESKFNSEKQRYLYLNCDIAEQKAVINTISEALIKQLLQNVDVLCIDEAQRLDDPGLTFKIIHDNFPKIKILVTGSSSFDIKNKISETMTGRYLDFTLYPLSFAEILKNQGETVNQTLLKEQADTLIPLIMTYGLYPKVYTEANPTKKQLLLIKLVESYLFKDVLMFERVRYSQAIKDLAKALAYQIGSEVNENELANRLKIDRKTVSKYIDILEKAFVIKRVFPYSKNPRREIGRNYKVYFVDLGIRNALIGDFNEPLLRADIGFMWENFLFIERMKLFANANQPLFEYNFWRNYSGAEVDYIEKPFSSPMRAYEFKYSSSTVNRGAHIFTKNYNVPVKVISKENYLDFITDISK